MEIRRPSNDIMCYAQPFMCRDPLVDFTTLTLALNYSCKKLNTIGPTAR